MTPAAAAALPGRAGGWRRREGALALVVLLGLALVVPLARSIDARRPALAVAQDERLYVSGETVRRFSLAFSGLAADWYWLRSLQYIGRKLEEQAHAGGLDPETMQLDRLTAVDAGVLAGLLDITTTLDPRFTAVYEFAAVVLPAVDAPAAIRLLEKGIAANPEQWYLHQQLAFVHWQREDYQAAAAAFRRGARTTTATWMEGMAQQMEERGAERSVAGAMYARMYEESKEEQVRQWALRRLMLLRWLDERDVMRRVLAAHREATGRCPALAAIGPELRVAGLRLDAAGAPLDPSGVPYVLRGTPDTCDVALGRGSGVPPQ